MADFQYTPDMNDPISKLRVAMDTMDGIVSSPLCPHPLTRFKVEAISKYRVPGESETSPLPPSEDVEMALDPSLQPEGQAGPSAAKAPQGNLRLFPPPLFSRQAISQGYKSVSFRFPLPSGLLRYKASRRTAHPSSLPPSTRKQVKSESGSLTRCGGKVMDPPLSCLQMPKFPTNPRMPLKRLETRQILSS
jgi:hypothetical protein